MHVLPARTAPSRERLKRRHRPAQGPYSRYRDCLRWEFGFTCAFCLVHEADLDEHGLGGLGTMWIEHYTPRVVAPQLVDRYDNCFYSCRFCNGRRRIRPLRAKGSRLLNPCRVAWADHFALDGNSLRPRTHNAEYTALVYGINDPRRTKIRCKRFKALEEALTVIKDRSFARIIKRARRAKDIDRATLQAIIRLLQAARTRALEQFQRYRAVPSTKKECRCKTAILALPPYLLRQVMDAPDIGQ